MADTSSLTESYMHYQQPHQSPYGYYHHSPSTPGIHSSLRSHTASADGHREPNHTCSGPPRPGMSPEDAYAHGPPKAYSPMPHYHSPYGCYHHPHYHPMERPFTCVEHEEEMLRGKLLLMQQQRILDLEKELKATMTQLSALKDKVDRHELEGGLKARAAKTEEPDSDSGTEERGAGSRTSRGLSVATSVDGSEAGSTTSKRDGSTNGKDPSGKKGKSDKEKNSNSDGINQSRYWSPAEHQLFLEALEIYGPKDVKAIAQHVRTRTATQVRTHAQKFYLRLHKETDTTEKDSKTRTRQTAMIVPPDAVERIGGLKRKASGDLEPPARSKSPSEQKKDKESGKISLSKIMHTEGKEKSKTQEVQKQSESSTQPSNESSDSNTAPAPVSGVSSASSEPDPSNTAPCA